MSLFPCPHSFVICPFISVNVDKLMAEMQAYHAKVKPEPVTYPISVTRSLVEEFSGKTFQYEEVLPIFENYTPDQKAADVGPGTRALADLCLLLLNSHEFVHVY